MTTYVICNLMSISHLYWNILQRNDYYDNRHQEASDLKEDKVYLIARNITTIRPSLKLDYQKIGPFAVEKKVGPVKDNLWLPESMKKIHSTFHIALLEKNTQRSKNRNVGSITCVIGGTGE